MSGSINLPGAPANLLFGPTQLRAAFAAPPGPPITDSEAFFVARLTFSDDAQGTLAYQGTTSGSGVAVFTLPIAGDPYPDGDFNYNGVVDNGDLNLLLSRWGQTTVPPEWVNGFVDGLVDYQEANALLRSWAFGAGISIPEPASLALLIPLLSPLLGGCRRNTRT
ncbi:hypothetical protein [Botrimarina hoheduenensis]|uniref:PEP-CTERM protein-sorting domain-containing protein n=1 Tax=Botrimarina hoheduenensis TaxID=2528000 RepID=A0A5C5W8T9_9BACT|nr:hypothetical protein [Botrimarina hoheduenensis]TWT46605.1 hypothetical protein Pla111_17010 [Botrimarina hoheduenensis]